MYSPVTAKKSVQASIASALGLADSATACEIYAALASAPVGSAADLLHHGLTDDYYTGKCHYGRMEYRTPEPFTDLTDLDEIEDALIAGLDRGSELINQMFRTAIDKDVADRNLVNDLGKTPKPTPVGGFGDEFNLLDYVRSRPFEAPFTGDMARDLNDGWGYKPRV